ncbi:MAG: IPT/TIG domain-containing protein [bacterium]
MIYLIIPLSIALFTMACSEEETTADEKGDYKTKIEKVSPTNYSVGDTITIFGNNFGETQGSQYIVLKGADIWEDGYADAEDYLEWSNDKIVIVVPEGATKGIIYINNRVSNGHSFELEKSFFVSIIELFIKLSLGITIVFIYLKINKIWKRKHEREVADSQSLTGLFIYIVNCVLWVIYYTFVENDVNSMIDTSIYIFEGSIFFIIGTGLFVKGQRKENLWILIRRALKLERKEADYLLKKWFKPQNAESILHILHQIAMIDEEFDPKEQEIIQTFAKEWNIDYDWEKLEKERKASKDNSYMRLRRSLEDYLFHQPPDEQVAQLKDMITTMIEADDKVTEEEALISSELLPMIENYLKQTKEIFEFKVLIVPQHPNQESAIKSLIPQADKIQTSGGEAFSVGTYYSHKYAEMMCEQYRQLQFFTIVNAPPGSETEVK